MKRKVLIAIVLCTVFFIVASSCLAQVINGCVRKNGQLAIVTGPGQCKQNETPISWNATGPQGPQGPAGPSTGASFLGTKSLTEHIVKAQFGVDWTTVVTVDLPAGTYLLTGDGVVNRMNHPGGSSIAVYCRLTGGGAELPFAIFNNGSTLETTPVALAGRVDLTVAGPASIVCAHLDFFDTEVQGVGFELLAEGVTVQVN